jgi:hypothetical protein
MNMAVLNANATDSHSTDVLTISWTYTNHGSGAKMPYTVPMDIAGIDKTILSDEGKLSDWLRIENSTDGGFKIIVFN